MNHEVPRAPRGREERSRRPDDGLDPFEAGETIRITARRAEVPLKVDHEQRRSRRHLRLRHVDAYFKNDGSYMVLTSTRVSFTFWSLKNLATCLVASAA